MIEGADHANSVMTDYETYEKKIKEFYTKANGEKPAKDFILGLDVKMLAKLYRKDYLERVKENE